MKRPYRLAVVLLLLAFVRAQTETVVNAAGATVVELLTVNAAGLPVTSVLQTLVGTGTSTSQALSATTTTRSLSQSTALTLATTTTPQQVGPVEQTTSQAPAGGETPYEYTTTDSNGNVIVGQGIFTPTAPQTVLPSQTTTGTILEYSQWLSMIGTNTVRANAAHAPSRVDTGWYYFTATTLAGLVGGVWLIVL